MTRIPYDTLITEIVFMSNMDIKYSYFLYDPTLVNARNFAYEIAKRYQEVPYKKDMTISWKEYHGEHVVLLDILHPDDVSKSLLYEHLFDWTKKWYRFHYDERESYEWLMVDNLDMHIDYRNQILVVISPYLPEVLVEKSCCIQDRTRILRKIYKHFKIYSLTLSKTN